MATVLVKFDFDKVPVVTGDMPSDAQTPISNPMQTGFVTNEAFIVPEGVYCFGLQSADTYAPLWQVVQASDDEQSVVTFRRLTEILSTDRSNAKGSRTVKADRDRADPGSRSSISAIPRPPGAGETIEDTTDFSPAKQPTSTTRKSSRQTPRTSRQVDPDYSSSVRATLGHFRVDPIAAAELAASILRDHAYYGAGRGGKVAGRLDALSLADPQAEKRAASEWVGQIAALFQPGTVVTGRCVVVGLAILDHQGVRMEILAEGFLAVLASEEQEGHPSAEARLTLEARKALDGLLSGTLVRSTLSGSTETLSDAPAVAATEDRLGRVVFAEVLAERIRRLRGIESKSPLVIHLDGPWGSGKSTVLNFLEAALTAGRTPEKKAWVVLRYNAWQQQRLDSPWWALTTLIAVEGARQLRQEHAWLRALMIGLRHFWFRTFAGRLMVLLAAFVAITVGLLLLYGFGSDAVAAGAATKSITQFKDALSVATIVFGVVLAGSRFLAAADASAQEFLRSRPDPLGALVRHVAYLLHLIQRPVAVLVDDMDRCDTTAVVRLLEGIHTVFGTLPIVFVAAGDGRWVARAFEKTYADNAPHSANPASGRPLGALFLEKIFQLSAVVPDMPQAFKSRFWRSLLGTQAAGPAVDGGEAAARIGSLRTEEDILAAVAAVDPRSEPAKAQALRDAAMRRLAQPDLIENPSRHVLEFFEGAVEANPRAMKRQVMAYGMARASDLASFRNTPQPLLAAWSVLCMRWPSLADWLREDPDRVSYRDPDEVADAKLSEVERPFPVLMRTAEVHSLVSRLDATALRRATGQGEEEP